jgi:hypothetical protein
LELLIDAGVGVFVSYNSVGRGQIDPRTIIWDAFLDRYFPALPSNLPTLDSAKNDANAISGNSKYRTKNVSFSETQFQRNSGLERYDVGSLNPLRIYSWLCDHDF